jgi:hypothetical protein
MGVHVTDGLGAASELLGSRAALVESAQVQAGVAECFESGHRGWTGTGQGNGALRDRAGLLEVAAVDGARRGRREQNGAGGVIV